jgi:hypothetical protein
LVLISVKAMAGVFIALHTTTAVDVGFGFGFLVVDVSHLFGWPPDMANGA